MNFEDALKAMKAGARIRRTTWPAEFRVKLDDTHTRMVDGKTERAMCWFTPDILAEDWEIAA